MKLLHTRIDKKLYPFLIEAHSWNQFSIWAFLQSQKVRIWCNVMVMANMVMEKYMEPLNLGTLLLERWPYWPVVVVVVISTSSDNWYLVVVVVWHIHMEINLFIFNRYHNYCYSCLLKKKIYFHQPGDLFVGIITKWL